MSKRVSNKANGGGSRSSRTWREHQIKTLTLKNKALKESVAAEMIRRDLEQRARASAPPPPTFFQRLKNLLRMTA